MTLKQFIKSKSLKCILVLLCIALVSGALLSILNDVLSVSSEERVSRTIKSIYGSEVKYTEIDVDYSTDKGTVESVYKLADGNYLIKSLGKDGYHKGTVTVWLVAKFENGNYTGISNVSIAEYEKQTLMSKFTGAVLNGYSGAVTKDDDFDTVVSGATFSSHALNNAVNCAVDCVYDVIIGG